MRDFTKYEKKILRKILIIHYEKKTTSLMSNLIDFEFSPNYYLDIKSEENCPVRISKSFLDRITSKYGTMGANEFIKQFSINLSSIIRLIQYLEQEKLISFEGELSLTTFGTSFDANEISIGYDLEDKEVIRMIYTYSQKKLILSERLKKIIRNNCKIAMEENKPTQEVHDPKSYRLLKWSLVIGITAIIVTLFIWLLDHSVNKTTNEFPAAIKDTTHLNTAPMQQLEKKTPMKPIVKKPDSIKKNSTQKNTDHQEKGKKKVYDLYQK
jgi:hypothetical protein